MPIPQVPGIPDCPVGLEFLLQLDRFIVSRYREGGTYVRICTAPITKSMPAKPVYIKYDRFVGHTLPFCAGFSLGNVRSYRVRNSLGQDIYFVQQSKSASLRVD